ncbi:MAG TPA: restriction endonuclease subunit S [Solirubrobacterales bacterium]|nr:restriction endonuclease subunit S [Solirubrobacterales bacterium]
MEEVATLVRQSIAPDEIPQGTAYVGLENIERGGRLTGVSAVGPGDLASAKFRFEPGDVLFGKLRPYLAKIARPDFEGVCSTDIIPIRPGPMLDRDYLSYFLLHPAMVALATVRASGASLPRLGPNELKQFQVPLSPLDDQRRIANILDQAGVLREHRERALQGSEELIGAVYAEMFGGDAQGSPGWTVAPLGELARVVRGASPRPAGDPRYFGGDIPWLKISDITAARGRYVTHIKEGVTDAGMGKSVFVEPGSLILTNSATVGIPKFLGVGACIHDGFLAFREMDEARLKPEYLYANLLVRREEIVNLAPHGTQRNLNTGIVKAIKVPLPSLAEQELFASRVDAIESTIEAQTRSLALLEELFASLQTRAFKGEL